MDENRKKVKHRIYVYASWLACGLIIMGFVILGVVEGEFFLPFSVVWCGISLVRIIKYGILLKNDDALDEYFLFENDERNSMIKHKAISIASYIIIFVSLGAIILSELMGKFVISAVIACMICTYVVIYAIAVMILRRKY